MKNRTGKRGLSLTAAVLLGFCAPAANAALVSNLSFDAGNLNDSSGHYHDFILPSGTAFNTGTIRYETNATGKDAYVASNQTIHTDIGTDVNLKNFTVSLWADVDLGVWDNLFNIAGSSTTSGNNGNYGLRFQTNDRYSTSGKYAIYVDSGASGIAGVTGFSCATAAGAGTYQHVVLSCANGKVTVYVNGASVGTANWTTTDKMGFIAFGGSFNQTSGDSRNLTAHLDNIAIYDRGLSAAEVATIMAEGSGTRTMFADVYSNALSGTANTFSGKAAESSWSHRFGTGAVDATNVTPGALDQMEFTAEAPASITLDQDVLKNPISFGSNNVSLNVEANKTIAVASLVGNQFGFTKTGTGTLKLTGTRNFDSVTGTGSNHNQQNITIEGGVLDVTGSAKLFSTDYRGSSVVTVKAGGTLQIGNFAAYGGSLGSLRSEANARVLDGGTVNVVGGTQSGGNFFSVTANGGTLNFDVPTGQTSALMTLAGDASTRKPLIDGNLTVSGTGNITLLRAIDSSANGGGIIKNGTGTLTFSGDQALGFLSWDEHDVTINAGTFKITGGAKLFNTYQGTSVVTVNAGGTLEVDDFVTYAGGSLGSLRADDGSVLLNGGTVKVTGAVQSGEIGFNVTGANSKFLVTNADAKVTFENKNSRTINVSAAGFEIGGEGNIEIAKPIQGSAGFTKVGSGTLKLSGNSNYASGDGLKFVVKEGVLEITGDAKLVKNYKGSSSLTVQDGGTLRVANFSAYGRSTGDLLSENTGRILDGGKVEVMTGAAGSNTFRVTANGGEFSVVNAGTTETFNRFKGDGTDGGSPATCCTTLDGTLTVSGAGTLVMNGRLIGAGGIIKNGTGTLLLNSAANSFTGAAIVNAGILGGTGSISDVVVEDGGTLTAASGTTVGTITMNDLTINDGGRLLINAAAGLNDIFKVRGDVMLAAGTLDFENPREAGAEVFDFMVLEPGSKVTLPSDLSLLLADDVQRNELGISFNPLTGTLSATVLPEPSAGLLLLAGIAGVGLFCRKKELLKTKNVKD